MAYEKHTWETGETITAEKLNNLEEGIEEAKNKSFLVTFNHIGGSLSSIEADKTYEEIVEAFNKGMDVSGYSKLHGMYLMVSHKPNASSSTITFSGLSVTSIGSDGNRATLVTYTITDSNVVRYCIAYATD